MISLLTFVGCTKTLDLSKLSNIESDIVTFDYDLTLQNIIYLKKIGTTTFNLSIYNVINETKLSLLDIPNLIVYDSKSYPLIRVGNDNSIYVVMPGVNIYKINGNKMIKYAYYNGNDINGYDPSSLPNLSMAEKQKLKTSLLDQSNPSNKIDVVEGLSDYQNDNIYLMTLRDGRTVNFNVDGQIGEKLSTNTQGFFSNILISKNSSKFANKINGSLQKRSFEGEDRSLEISLSRSLKGNCDPKLIDFNSSGCEQSSTINIEGSTYETKNNELIFFPVSEFLTASNGSIYYVEGSSLKRYNK